MEHDYSALFSQSQSHCTGEIHHQVPCCETCPRVPRILEPHMSVEDFDPGTIVLSQDQHRELGTSPVDFPCNTLVDVQDAVTSAMVPTFATQVFSECLGSSFERFNAHVPSECLVLEANDDAFKSPDCHFWNVSCQQYVASLDNHIGPTLMSYDRRSDDLRGIGEFNTMVSSGDNSGSSIVPIQDGDIELVPGWTMPQYPRPHLGSLPPSSLPEHYSASYPVLSSSGQVSMNFFSSDLPLAPPMLEQDPCYLQHEHYATSGGEASRSDSGHTHWTSSASMPAITSDSSFHLCLDPIPSTLAGSQEVPMQSKQRPFMNNPRAQLPTDWLYDRRQPRVRRYSRPRSLVNVIPCSGLGIVGDGERGIPMTRQVKSRDFSENNTDCYGRRSSTNRLSAPGDPTRRRRGSTATPSEASVTPSTCDDIMPCKLGNCSATFRGRYRRGNLSRHIRLIHTEVRYPCDVHGCDKIFNRKDARLNHHRKVHTADLPFLKPPLRRDR